MNRTVKMTLELPLALAARIEEVADQDSARTPEQWVLDALLRATEPAITVRRGGITYEPIGGVIDTPNPGRPGACATGKARWAQPLTFNEQSGQWAAENQTKEQ